MVKHIDGKEITSAGRMETICHSYGGATIDQIHNKIGLMQMILFTKGLKKQQSLEELVKDIKAHAQNVTVSSIIKRFDGKVRSVILIS